MGPGATRNKKQETRNKGGEWIIDELDKTSKAITKHLENLELHLAVEEIYEFVWHKFADKYIEESKESESKRAREQETLEYVLKQVLILLHPFMPFLTEEIYQKFGDKRESIMLEDWPSSNEAPQVRRGDSFDES